MSFGKTERLSVFDFLPDEFESSTVSLADTLYIDLTIPAYSTDGSIGCTAVSSTRFRLRTYVMLFYITISFNILLLCFLKLKASLTLSPISVISFSDGI